MRFNRGRRSFLLGTAATFVADFVLLVPGLLSGRSVRAAGQPVSADSTVITVDSTVIDVSQGAASGALALVTGTTFNTSGTPEQGVRVRALDPATRNEFARVFSDANGQYSLNLDPGIYEIRANKSGWGAISIAVTAGAGATHIVDFGNGAPPPPPQEGTGLVTGTTFNASGTPEQGVRVRALDPATRNEFARVFSDANGQYSLDLDPGIYEIRANKSGWGATSLGVTVVAGATHTVDFGSGTAPPPPPPQETALLTGTTFNASGALEEAVRVRALDPATRDEFARVFSDANGQYSLDLDPGTYTIRANKPGWGAISMAVTVVAGEIRILDISP
ncbi:carboxypeptidase family protein [Thiogranum longum]|uniref:Carboxypeptidase family protein n=1 Tax=Thiogranum longum TaxID=1537524 RepID=A0A4R1HAB4_9GAMM|nr:carboxypeptidase-like regulatory domain-containing protein [Thiogranum longum]TCK17501.1 carboxypeptidase family protein [Thiogranum longum]